MLGFFGNARRCFFVLWWRIRESQKPLKPLLGNAFKNRTQKVIHKSIHILKSTHLFLPLSSLTQTDKQSGRAGAVTRRMQKIVIEGLKTIIDYGRASGSGIKLSAASA